MHPSAHPQTLFDKLWQSHLIDETPDGECLIYVDRHLVYEVTSPQAFEGLRLSNRQPWRPSTTIAVADHNVPTTAAQRTSVDAIEDPLYLEGCAGGRSSLTVPLLLTQWTHQL